MPSTTNCQTGPASLGQGSCFSPPPSGSPEVKEAEEGTALAASPLRRRDLRELCCAIYKEAHTLSRVTAASRKFEIMDPSVLTWFCTPIDLPIKVRAWSPPLAFGRIRSWEFSHVTSAPSGASRWNDLPGDLKLSHGWAPPGQKDLQPRKWGLTEPRLGGAAYPASS